MSTVPGVGFRLGAVIQRASDLKRNNDLQTQLTVVDWISTFGFKQSQNLCLSLEKTLFSQGLMPILVFLCVRNPITCEVQRILGAKTRIKLYLESTTTLCKVAVLRPSNDSLPVEAVSGRKDNCIS